MRGARTLAHIWQDELDRKRWPFPLRATVRALEDDWLVELDVETFAENELVTTRLHLTPEQLVTAEDRDYIVERAVLSLTKATVRGRQ